MCVERYCEFDGKSAAASNLAETPRMDDPPSAHEHFNSTGETARACAQIVFLKCWYFARIVDLAMDGQQDKLYQRLCYSKTR